MDAVECIRQIADRVVRAHGLELFDVQVRNEAHGWVVRVVVDRPGSSASADESVSIGDCETVSRELGTILDVEDPLTQAYTLEVSSPGLDRPLRGEADFRRFTGRLASLVTDRAVEGQTYWRGRLVGVDGGAVVLAIGRKGREARVPLGAVKRARLEVEF